MAYLLSAHSLAVILALVAGLVVGLLTWSKVAAGQRWGGWLPWGAGFYALGFVLAVTKLIPRTLGYWLDVGLLLVGFYLVGCFIGACLAGLRDGFLPAYQASAFPKSPVQRNAVPTDGQTALAFAAPAADAAAVSATPATPESAASALAAVPATALTQPVTAPAPAGPRPAAGPAPGATPAAASEGGHLASAHADAAVPATAAAAAPTIAESTGSTREAASQPAAVPAPVEPTPVGVPTAAMPAPAKLETTVHEPAAASPGGPDASAFSQGIGGVPTAPSAEQASASQSNGPAAEPAATGHRPPAEARPEDGSGDDLKLIRGIGPRNETILHGQGIWRFRQIAAWKTEEAAWINSQIAFPGRVEREHWIEQARLLSAGVLTPHAAAVMAGQAKPDDEPVPEAEAAALLSSLPAVAPPAESDTEHAGQRPVSLIGPAGAADDLKRISGIGRQNESRLNALGIWHFRQIAAWTDDNIRWVSSYLAFPGRIDRENWVSQAKILASGGETQFSQRVDRGEVPTSSNGVAPKGG